MSDEPEYNIELVPNENFEDALGNLIESYFHYQSSIAEVYEKWQKHTTELCYYI